MHHTTSRTYLSHVPQLLHPISLVLLVFYWLLLVRTAHTFATLWLRHCRSHTLSLPCILVYYTGLHTVLTILLISWIHWVYTTHFALPALHSFTHLPLSTPPLPHHLHCILHTTRFSRFHSGFVAVPHCTFTYTTGSGYVWVAHLLSCTFSRFTLVRFTTFLPPGSGSWTTPLHCTHHHTFSWFVWVLVPQFTGLVHGLHTATYTLHTYFGYIFTYHVSRSTHL